MMSRIFSEGMMPQTELVLGLVQHDLKNKNYSLAMQRLVSVSNECSKNIEFLTLLSFTQKALSDFSGQIKTLEVIADLTESHVAHLDFMSALYAAGRLNEALDVGLHLQELTLNADNAKYFTRMMVRIYLEFSDFEGMHEVLDLYRLQYELDDLMYWGLGFAHLADGKNNEALDHFRRAIEINPNNDKAWTSLALLHDEMGDRELALANLERALDINPNNTTGLKLMSRWHHKDLEKTNNVLNKLSYYLSTHSFNEEVSLCYVQMLKDNNDTALAQFEIEKLILTDPSNVRFISMKKNIEASANLV